MVIRASLEMISIVIGIISRVAYIVEQLLQWFFYDIPYAVHFTKHFIFWNHKYKIKFTRKWRTSHLITSSSVIYYNYTVNLVLNSVQPAYSATCPWGIRLNCQQWGKDVTVDFRLDHLLNNVVFDTANYDGSKNSRTPEANMRSGYTLHFDRYALFG